MKSAGLACVLMALTAAAAPMVYENDFSTRRSAPLPSGQWYETRYHVGTLFNNYDPKSWGDTAPYASEANIQDGWMKAFQGVNVGGLDFACATNSSGTASQPGDTNMFARFSNSQNGERQSYALHPLHNEFSNGVLRISCDMRCPSVWYPAANATCRITPIYKKFVDPGWNGSQKYATNWGPDLEAGSFRTTAFLLTANGAGGSQAAVRANPGGPLQTNHWYRYVVDLNLEKNTAKGTVYHLGEAHPTFETTGSSIGTYAESHFNFNLSADWGPVAGIGLYAKNVYSGASGAFAVTNAVCFDNISVAWKAPGATDYVLCYENDFSVRRYRTICSEPSPTYDYVATTENTSSTFVAYQATPTATNNANLTLLLPTATGNHDTLQPLGLDGWRRVNNDGPAYACISTLKGAGGPALRFYGNGSDFAIAVQTLGESITSGKVRISADFRTPDKWYHSSRMVQLALGNDAYWTSTWTDLNNKLNWCCRAGVGGNGSNGSDTKFYPCSSTATGTSYDSTASCGPTNWYRVVMTADVGQQTYDCELYDIGPSNSVSASWQPTTAPIYSRTGAPFRINASEIATFGLLAYGARRATVAAEHIYFDNIKVWKNAGAANEKLIYENDFKTRKRYFDTPVLASPLTVNAAGVDNGQDHWIRYNNGQGSDVVLGGANPCVRASCPLEHSYAVQDLGQHFERGVVCVQADIRPPQFWTWGTARAASVTVGDSLFLQGNRSNYGTEQFIQHYQMTFGFGDNSGGTGAGTWIPVKFRYGNGHGDGTVATTYLTNAVSKTHWYRFRAEADLAKETWLLRIYDMGTPQPELTTPDGMLVATVRDLGFRRPPEGGLSAISLNTYGVACFLSARGVEDPGPAFYDNLRVWQKSTGTLVIVR